MSADAGRTRETKVAQLEVAQPVVSNTPQHGSTDSSFGGDCQLVSWCAKEQPRGSDPPKLLSPDALVVASSVRIGSCVLAHVSHDHNSKHVDFQ